jgi:hypothetical protein
VPVSEEEQSNMAARKKASAQPVRPYLGSTDPEDLSPAYRVANEILATRADLLPSVDRIVGAGLNESNEERALSLFRDSLGRPGDPHRDPIIAIAAATTI